MGQSSSFLVFPEVCLWDSRNFSGPEVKLEDDSGQGRGGVALEVWMEFGWACWVEVLGLGGPFSLLAGGGISDPQRWVEFFGEFPEISHGFGIEIHWKSISGWRTRWWFQIFSLIFTVNIGEMIPNFDEWDSDGLKPPTSFYLFISYVFVWSIFSNLSKSCHVFLSRGVWNIVKTSHAATLRLCWISKAANPPPPKKKIKGPWNKIWGGGWISSFSAGQLVVIWVFPKIVVPPNHPF